MHNNSSLQLLGISGQIGKRLVFKRYGRKTVVTRYPDMSGVVLSPQQRACNNRFAAAVAYARSVLQDPVLKAAFAEQLPQGDSIYHAAIRAYLRQQGCSKERF